MQRIMMALFWSIALLTTGCNSKTDEIIRPSNFAFVFDFSSCGPDLIYTFDTNKGVITYNPIDSTKLSVIQMQLTNGQLDLIFQKITNIDFFSYPELYTVPDEQIRGYQAPSATYKLTVTNGSQTHSVTWTDEIFTEPPYVNLDNLKELSDLILEPIWANPDYLKLIESLPMCL